MRKTSSLLLVVAILTVSAGTSLAGGHSVAYTVTGSKGHSFGSSVSGAGDVDADGCDDFIVGAPQGRYVKVYSGKTGKTLYSFTGSSLSADDFGGTVSGAGDVNGDGYADVIVGARSDSTVAWIAGLARVYSGKDGSTLYSFRGSEGDVLGYSVSGAGDVNADGYDDLVVSAASSQNGSGPGYVKVYSGKDGTTLHTISISSPTHNGLPVSGAGDVNGDGYDDIVIGTPADKTKASDAGKAQVVSGKDGKVLHVFYGDSSWDMLGWSVDGAGDMNGDGYDDVVVGAKWDSPGGNTYSGTVTVFSGKDGKVLGQWYGSAAGDGFGYSVDGGGDVNKDGYPDIVVGADGVDKNATDGGSLTVISGKDGKTLYTFHGTAKTERLGASVCILGDANNDGFDDFVAGSPGSQPGGSAQVWTSPPATGAVTINSGEELTSSASVTLSLTYAPGVGSTVKDMRIRNSGDAWGAWMPVAGTWTWSLASGSDGTKTVEVQVRDDWGAVSALMEDNILLDRTPPDGAIVINGDVSVTTSVFVTLFFEYTDLLTEATHVRIRNEGEGWGPWLLLEDDISPSRDRKPWVLPDNGGFRTVEAQFKDTLDNISDTVSDSIEYLDDAVAPTIDSLRVSPEREYILPDEAVQLRVYSRDNLGGAGVDAFKVSFDSGNSWSDWYTLEYGPVVSVAYPDTPGCIVAKVVVRDRAWNESDSETVEFTLLGREQPWMGAGAKAAGRLDEEWEVDAWELGLVAGDILTVKIKGKASEPGASLALALDLVRADGTRLIKGRYPEDSKAVTVKRFVVPETGRYLLIVRSESGEGGRIGTYKLTAKVKQAKENKKLAGSFTGQEIVFEAAHGSTVKVTLKGDGITPDSVTLEGPEGPVEVVTKGGAGSVKLTAVADAGTGAYRIRLGGPVTVSAKVKVKNPKIKGTVEE